MQDHLPEFRPETNTRLFLIDQSLKDQSGHHYDYVRCIADQSARMGLPTRIGVNRKWTSGSIAAAATQSVFQNTTYSPLSTLVGLRKTTRSRFFDHDQRVDPSLDPRGPENKADFFFRWKRTWGRFNLAAWQRLSNRYVGQFQAGLATFFREIQLRSSDHIFFVTVSELECLAIAQFMTHLPTSIHANWHLQFHFDWMDEFDVDSRNDRAFQLFRQAAAGLKRHSVFFYTTSQPLADQYNRLGLQPFLPLPYPVNRDFFQPCTVKHNDSVTDDGTASRTSPRLSVAIAGGIRREKGTRSFLPKLTRAIARDANLRDQVKLRVQGNKSRSRRINKALGGDYLDWVPHPLPAGEYVQFIRQSDVGLLNYDREIYRNRRAGILGEFLSAGKPVIVPSACWLSDQIAIASQGHARSLLEKESIQIVDRQKWDAQAEIKMRFDSTDIPESHQLLLISFQSDESPDFERYRSFQIEFEDQPFISRTINRMESAAQFVIVRIPSSSRGAIVRCPPNVRRTQLWRLASTAELPISSVGLIIESDEELPSAIAEMVRHRAHYQSTAAEFALTWNQDHDSEKTLLALLNAAKPRNFSAA